MVLEAWTDGSYKASTDIGGIGVVIKVDGQPAAEICQAFTATTNNRMELLAIQRALEWIDKPYDKVTIYTDSRYCIGMLCYNWEPKVNYHEIRNCAIAWARACMKFKCKQVNFCYVRGHGTCQENIRADYLAVHASTGYLSTLPSYRYMHNTDLTLVEPVTSL